MTRALRAVFLSPIAPAKTGNGLAMRMGQFADALARVADLSVIVVPAAGDTGFRAQISAGAEAHTRLIEIDAPGDTHFLLLSRISDPLARLEAFRAYGKPSLARRLSAPVLADIARRIETFRPDIVHIGRSYMLPCAAVVPGDTPVTCDLDEDDWTSYVGQARIARLRGDIVRSGWLGQEGVACDRLIARWRQRLRRIFVASPAEGQGLAFRHPGLKWEVAENSVEIPRRSSKRDDGETLLFVGSLGYGPNADGLLWFHQHVLPRLRAGAARPCRLIIAGGNGGPKISALARHPRIVLLGRVADLAPLYRRATLAVAPLHSGGGTRIKLLEAAAHGTASVATELAAAGIGWPRESGGWQARSVSEFARACEEGLASKVERDRRAARGLDWVTRHHSRPRVVSRLARSFIAALDQRPSIQKIEETLE